MPRPMKITEVSASGVTVDCERVVDLNLVDNVALLADTWFVMFSMVMQMKEVTRRFGASISARKSDVLYSGRGEVDLGKEYMQFRAQKL